MKTKEQLQEDILKEIADIKRKMDVSSFSNEQSDATNRIAISNLYSIVKPDQ